MRGGGEGGQVKIGSNKKCHFLINAICEQLLRAMMSKNKFSKYMLIVRNWILIILILYVPVI